MHATLENVIYLMGEENYWPVIVRVVPDREKPVTDAFAVT